MSQLSVWQGSQFRCGGSAAYLDWLEGLLSDDVTGDANAKWNRATNEKGTFSLEIVDDPQWLDDKLRPFIAEGKTARLAASYARKWKTKGIDAPHNLPHDKKDFAIPYSRDGISKVWDKVWNFVPGGDYTHFIQGGEGSQIASDPLCEVGCPYVIRGFDFDYLGVLWLSDLVWRTDRWVAQVDHVHDSALPRTRKAAKGKGVKRIGADTSELILRLQRGYRILMSRAIHGLYVWIEDDETRTHVKQLLGQ